MTCGYTQVVRKVKNVCVSKVKTFAHTTRAGVSLYQISRLVCSLECRQLPGGKQFTDDEDLQEIRPVGAEMFHADGNTDITKLTFAFRNFATASKYNNTYSKVQIKLAKHKYRFRLQLGHYHDLSCQQVTQSQFILSTKG